MRKTYCLVYVSDDVEIALRSIDTVFNTQRLHHGVEPGPKPKIAETFMDTAGYRKVQTCPVARAQCRRRLVSLGRCEDRSNHG